jgi:hypothetical protein
MKTRIIIMTVLFTTNVLLLNAQAININGKIVDEQSNPINNVKITLQGKAIVVYSNSQGDFAITYASGIEINKHEPEQIYYDGEAVYFKCNNQDIIITIYDITGQLITQLISPYNYPATFKFYPSAYIPYADNKVYVISVYTNEQLYSIKIINSTQMRYEKGILPADHINQLKHGKIQSQNIKVAKIGEAINDIDKLILEHNSFQKKEISISSYTQNLGNITMSRAIPNAPSNFTVDAEDPKTIRLRWTDNSDNETGFEIQRETSEGSNVYNTVLITSPNVVSYTDGPLGFTFYGYRIRAVNGSASSQWTAKTLAPPKLRIINNLDNRTLTILDVTSDWSKLNNIVRVRIGPTENDVINNTAYEKLEPKETSYSYDIDYIQPAYNSTPTFSNYEDFEVSTYGYGVNYAIFIQCGWWEYDAVVYFAWIKRVTSVLCANSQCCCYKWVAINVSNHQAGYCVIKAADFLPLRHWNGM